MPASVGERLFSVLLHCVKWGGSRLTPALPACQHPLPAPGIWAVLGWLSRPHHRTSPFHSLLTHAQGQAHASALVLLGEWPPANLKGERLGLLQGTRSLAQRLSSLGKTPSAWSNSPCSPPAFAGASHTQQFGSKKKTGPNLHYLQGSSCCPAHEERESPRDLFEMVLGHFPSWRESRSSGHGGARKQLVTSRPPCQHPSGALGWSHQSPLAAYRTPPPQLPLSSA